jgi:lysyl-tRNA synthetase class 2
MSEQNQNNAQEPQQDLNQLLKVRREKLAALQEAGKDPFVITKYDQTYHSDRAKEEYEKLEKELLGDWSDPDTAGMDEQAARETKKNAYNERRAIMDAHPIEVSIAGRQMFKRVMGKASFCNLRDLKGDIQAYV